MGNTFVRESYVNLFRSESDSWDTYANEVAPVRTPGHDVAVCFSGGGCRAMMAAMGQMRGLKHIGLLDKIRYVSGVSGGAWATTLYCYIPEHMTDDDLLGEIATDPRRLTLFTHDRDSKARALNHLPSNGLGRVPGRLSYAELAVMGLDALEGKIPANEIWTRLVGNDFLSHFGLYHGFGVSAYFTRDEHWFSSRIAPSNPHLGIADFHTYPSDRQRPYLLVWGSLIPRIEEDNYALLPMLFSPCWAGVLSDFSQAEAERYPIGGGAIDPFGLSSTPTTPQRDERVPVTLAQNRFSISDMVSITSAFYAEGLASKHPELSGLIPEYPYWPVTEQDQAKVRHYGFADGGSLEDTGIAGTLRFNPASVIAFINSITPLDWDSEYECPVVDEQIPPLFGYQPYVAGWKGGAKGIAYAKYRDGKGECPALEPDFETFRENQVFPSEAFKDLLFQMWSAHQRGGTVFCHQPGMATLENHKYGVSNGCVNILWVYNTPVKEWERQLSWPVKAYMKINPIMHHFPNFPTSHANLSAREVNMLAHLSSWNVTAQSTLGSAEGLTNQRMFERMFEPT